MKSQWGHKGMQWLRVVSEVGYKKINGLEKHESYNMTKLISFFTWLDDHANLHWTHNPLESNGTDSELCFGNSMEISHTGKSIPTLSWEIRILVSFDMNQSKQWRK